MPPTFSYSCQNEKETLKPLQNNKIESDYMRKEIKVSKTKSLLKFPKESKNSAHNIKVMKTIIKGKSENHLKVRKKIRIMKIDSCTIEGKSFKQKYNQENFFMKEKFLSTNKTNINLIPNTTRNDFDIIPSKNVLGTSQNINNFFRKNNFNKFG